MLIERRPWTWKNVKLPRKLEDELGRDFLLGVYTCQLDHEPESVEILMELGNLYTLNGQVQEGLHVDLRLVDIKPHEPILHYNLACSQSLLNDVEAGLASLRCAIELGYSNIEYLQEDSDLENLRKDERFGCIVTSMRSKAHQQEGEHLA